MLAEVEAPAQGPAEALPSAPDSAWLERRLEELAEVRRVRADNAQVRADMHARVDARCDAADAPMATREAQLLEAVRGYAAAFRAHLLPPGRKSRALPGGTVGWRASARRLVVEAPAVLAEWCRRQPDAERLGEVVYRPRLRDVQRLVAGTDDAPPGCRWQEAEERFFVETETEAAIGREEE